MKIIDSHFHWWPRSIFEPLLKREGFPRAVVNARGGYTYHGANGRRGTVASWKEWFDLDEQLGYMDSLGHDISVVCSIGPLSIYFSELPVEEGRDAALAWNEEMAWAQRRYPGRVWASAAIPLVDTRVAIEVLDDAVNRLGLMGVNLPGSVGKEGMIDDVRLEPFYQRVAELGLPMFLHPTDAVFADVMQGYNDALHLSLGRVVEVSAAASRLILSGMMERHPGLKIVMSHTGGALPYQSGRMDKNSKTAGLTKPVSHYLHQMFTDTVSPHSAGQRFAIEYFGADNVMYGTDYPCWDPAVCLKLLDEIEMSAATKQKIFHDNAVRILGLKPSKAAAA
ncbi:MULTISPECIES: amidohydrolase family protein [unclassified Neorhizobium]|uniref:amidohydrolase family protein n=1 Tax=unclassified Neorhizobium TaxID=2629175 RepID=UPI001FF245B1|nr:MULTISPECIES: amidohydrolase family protein [unclassified Neorhizobium]MCJ9669690.1 amidohydrolase [Neorhizobium sp. SHOUNA12B]MCJ9746108.1 amidohydrolase [Neorhizobium sp. SHOUNA12A]